MAKHKKPTIPKTNTFMIPIDHSKRPCFIVVEMIKAGKTSKPFIDRKKKEKRERCRKPMADE